jgi:hypothetical protein
LLIAWTCVGAVGYAYVSSLVRLVRAGRSQGVLTEMATATADALHEAGLVSRGGRRVRIEPGPDGSYRAYLSGVPARESALFAAALDEVIAPLGQPRYVVPRRVADPPGGVGDVLAMAGRAIHKGKPPETVVYHAVPAILSTNKKRAEMFAAAWRKRVSPGDLIYTGAAEGTGILAAQQGDDPFAITTQLRTVWRS